MVYDSGKKKEEYCLFGNKAAFMVKPAPRKPGFTFDTLHVMHYENGAVPCTGQAEAKEKKENQHLSET